MINDVLDIFGAIWNTFYSLIDTVASPRSLLTGLIVLIIGMTIIGFVSNIVVRLLMLLVVGTGIYFSLTSIDALREPAGLNLVFIATIVILFILGTRFWDGGMSKKAKGGVIGSEALLFFAFLAAVNAFFPDLLIGEQISAAIGNIGDFSSRLLSASQDGADQLGGN